MSEEESKQGKAENAFQNFGKKVDQFMVELDEASKKLNKEFNEKYDELRDAAKKMKEEAKNKERWKEVEDSLQKAGEELKNAFTAAFKKETPKQE